MNIMKCYKLRLPTEQDIEWYKKNRDIDINFLRYYQSKDEPPPLIVDWGGGMSTIWAAPDTDLVFGNVFFEADRRKYNKFIK